MPNMSYCRFQNTLADLRECYDNMDVGDLSADEKKARSELLRLCGMIAQDYEDEASTSSQAA